MREYGDRDMYEIEFPEQDAVMHARWRAEVDEAGRYVDAANEYIHATLTA